MKIFRTVAFLFLLLLTSLNDAKAEEQTTATEQNKTVTEEKKAQATNSKDEKSEVQTKTVVASERVEGPRDMNLFNVEPTVLGEPARDLDSFLSGKSDSYFGYDARTVRHQ